MLLMDCHSWIVAVTHPNKSMLFPQLVLCPTIFSRGTGYETFQTSMPTTPFYRSSVGVKFKICCACAGSRPKIANKNIEQRQFSGFITVALNMNYGLTNMDYLL